LNGYTCIRVKSAVGRIFQIAQLGHPVLRRKSAPVAEIDGTVIELIDDLFATSADANGAGIAAPQIYVSLRVFILSIRPTPRYPNAPQMSPTAVINPEILNASSATETDWEGCLSVPGIRGRVPRPKTISVRYSTRKGKQIECDFSGFAARVFLHEYDHLEGLTWLDHVEDNRDIVSEKEYLRLVSDG
jgi:peptide deformylase